MLEHYPDPVPDTWIRETIDQSLRFVINNCMACISDSDNPIWEEQQIIGRLMDVRLALDNVSVPDDKSKEEARCEKACSEQMVEKVRELAEQLKFIRTKVAIKPATEVLEGKILLAAFYCLNSVHPQI